MRRIGFLQGCGDECCCVAPIVYEETLTFRTILLYHGEWYDSESIEEAKKDLATACERFQAENEEA